MEKIEWRNERRRVADLVPWEKNPRKITPEQLEHLKRSIERFGYAAPVVVNADGTIVAGHMRTRAMLELGMGETEVDVRVASRLLEDEELSELAIRDNQNGGGWNWEELALFDREFLVGLGFEEGDLLKNLGLSRVEQSADDEERLEVLSVFPPEAPRLRERAAFHCGTFEEYMALKKFFGDDGSGSLDMQKLKEAARLAGFEG